MCVRLCLGLVFLCLVLIFSQESGAAKLSPGVHVGIVRDGPSETVPELRDLIQKEILELTSGESDVRFPDEFAAQS